MSGEMASIQMSLGSFKPYEITNRQPSIHKHHLLQEIPSPCGGQERNLWPVTLLYDAWRRFDLQTQTARLLLIHDKVSLCMILSVCLFCIYHCVWSVFSFALIEGFDLMVLSFTVRCTALKTPTGSWYVTWTSTPTSSITWPAVAMTAKWSFGTCDTSTNRSNVWRSILIG